MSDTVKWREGLQFDLDLNLDIVKIQFEWTDWLAEIGADTLSTANISIDAGLTQTGLVIAGTTATVSFACDLGTPPAADDILKATCQAVTGGGQKKARSINFRVVDRQ